MIKNIWSLSAFNEITHAIKFIAEGNCNKIEITRENQPGMIKIYKVKDIIRIDIQTA